MSALQFISQSSFCLCSGVELEEVDGRLAAGADYGGVVSFDQARLIRHNQILAANGIDPSGEPPLQLPPILEFTRVAMKACLWTQRRSLAYD